MKKERKRYERLSVSQFEGRVPEGAKLTRVRLNGQGCVVFALGYNAEETAALMWTGRGFAFARVISTRARALHDEVRRAAARFFNGHLYYRCPKYDICPTAGLLD